MRGQPDKIQDSRFCCSVLLPLPSLSEFVALGV